MRFLWMEVKPGKMETVKPADDRDGILDIQSNFTNEIVEQMRYDRENCTQTVVARILQISQGKI